MPITEVHNPEIEVAAEPQAEAEAAVEIQDDAPDAEAQAVEQPAEAADEGEVVVSIGEPEPDAEGEQAAPSWVKELRRENREKARRIRELEAMVSKAQPEAIQLGAKPTLEACDYDAERFERELSEWTDKKLKVEIQQRQREQAAEQERQQWASRVEQVQRAAQSLRLPDADEAATVFEDVFSPMQQGIIFGGPEDPKSSALLRYVLGKNPGKAAELAAIKDPVKFTFAVAKLESQVKVSSKKPLPPTPEKRIQSATSGAAAIDATLTKLQAEAERTGDRTKVAQYLRQKAAAR